MLTVLLASTELQNAPKLHPVLPAEGRPSTALDATLGVLLPALLSAPESHVLQGWCGAPKAGSGTGCASSSPHTPSFCCISPCCASCGLSLVFARSVLALGSGGAGSLHPPASVGWELPVLEVLCSPLVCSALCFVRVVRGVQEE